MKTFLIGLDELYKDACWFVGIGFLSNETTQSNSLDKEAKSANIIFILVDDMGYSGIGCYGSEIEIPLNQFYVVKTVPIFAVKVYICLLVYPLLPKYVEKTLSLFCFYLRDAVPFF